MKKMKKWDLKSVKEEALKYKLPKDFRTKSSGAYKWANRNNCLDELIFKSSD